MEDDRSNVHELDLENSDRPVWLMKCPVVVAKAWGKKAPPPSSSSFSSFGSDSLAKVVHSVDFLQSEPKSPYEGGRVNIQHEGGGGEGGYGASGGGYKSMMPGSGPSSTQVLSLLVGVPIVGSLLAIAGLLLAGSVIGLMISIPLFLLFSPVIVPAALTIGLATTGFLTSGMFGLTGLSSISWVMNYLRGTRRSVPEQLEYAKRRMADAVSYAGQKGKEMGQHVQNKAQEAKQYDISKTHDTTTKGHETTQRTAAV